eukprot:gene57710-biopygen66769
MVVRDGNFELLGAPIGDAQYCASYTADRVAKAEPRLDALAELDDPHVAYQLLRNCASFGRVIYSMRVTPADWHVTQLQAFDSAVRRCFELFSGVHCDARQWRQATLGIRNAGLGLRDAARHAPAAYVASRCACAEQCRDVDPAHTWDSDTAGSHVARAVSVLNAEFLESDRIPSPVPLTMRQQRLSLALDRAVLKELQGPAASLSQRAHLQLELAEGAGAWLNAMPSSVLGTHVHAQLFRIMLRRRLRVRVFDRSFHCPCCDSVMDMCGDHALACGGGGDRTLRHNALRNLTYHYCNAAGLRPELEKSGLLRPRLLEGVVEEDGQQRGGARGPDGRRPADVYLPCWRAGRPAALDFAVTSGLRIGAVGESAADGSAATTLYAARKRAFLNTDAHCAE